MIDCWGQYQLSLTKPVGFIFKAFSLFVTTGLMSSVMTLVSGFIEIMEEEMTDLLYKTLLCIYLNGLYFTTIMLLLMSVSTNWTNAERVRLDLFIHSAFFSRTTACCVCFAHVFAHMIFCDMARKRAPNGAIRDQHRHDSQSEGFELLLKLLLQLVWFSGPSIAPLYINCAISCQNSHCYISGSTYFSNSLKWFYWQILSNL